MKPTPTSGELAGQLAEALRGILPMAREGQRARVSPSSHQAFIQDDLDDIRMAEKALAKYDSAQSAPEMREKLPMALITQEWLDHHVETDPDCDTEASSAPERGGAETYTQEDLDRAEAKAAQIIADIPVDKRQPVLAAPPDPDGWIPWSGGECPVAPETLVDTKFRNGSRAFGEAADEWDWLHRSTLPLSDIIAYRPAGSCAKP